MRRAPLQHPDSTLFSFAGNITKQAVANLFALVNATLVRLKDKTSLWKKQLQHHERWKIQFATSVGQRKNPELESSTEIEPMTSRAQVGRSNH